MVWTVLRRQPYTLHIMFDVICSITLRKYSCQSNLPFNSYSHLLLIFDANQPHLTSVIDEPKPNTTACNCEFRFTLISWLIVFSLQEKIVSANIIWMIFISSLPIGMTWEFSFSLKYWEVSTVGSMATCRILLTCNTKITYDLSLASEKRVISLPQIEIYWTDIIFFI